MHFTDTQKYNIFNLPEFQKVPQMCMRMCVHPCVNNCCQRHGFSQHTRSHQQSQKKAKERQRECKRERERSANLIIVYNCKCMFNRVSQTNTIKLIV